MITPHVTDHAVVRYCQRGRGRAESTTQELRAAGIDVDALRAAIADLLAPAVENRAPGFTHGGLRFMLVEHVCTTVLTREMYWSDRPRGMGFRYLPSAQVWRLPSRPEPRP